jgi:hypothetical protein
VLEFPIIALAVYNENSAATLKPEVYQEDDTAEQHGGLWPKLPPCGERRGLISWFYISPRKKKSP